MGGTDVALTLTVAQLWAAAGILVASIVALVLFIYHTGQSRVDARLTGLHSKVNHEVQNLRVEFTENVKVQNQQLDKVIATIENSGNSLRTLYHDLDKRLYAHEVIIRAANNKDS